ncbi:MAG: outer membrane lipoprotein-sorting protein [Terracidiphilus sp.]
MRSGVLALALSMLLPAATQAALPQSALQKTRRIIETADYSVKGRLVRVQANGKRTSYGVRIKAHWFPKALRVLLEVNSPSEARVHLLLEMRPGEHDTILIAHPGDARPTELPFDKWTEGPLGDGFSFEDFLDATYFWAGQKDLGEVKFGVRQCDQLLSTPGEADRTHYSKIESWLVHESGFPVYVEKTLRGSGMVKEFTSFGLRRTEGVWSASQVEEKARGHAGSSLFIIDRGTAKAHLELKDFSPTQLTRF